jgi:hypothetical protein
MWETYKLTGSVDHDDCSKSERRTRSTNILTFRTNEADLGVCLHGYSNMCQELFVRDRRNINISGLPNESSCNESKLMGSETLTILDEPIGKPAAKHCLERCVNVSVTTPQEPSSSRVLSTVQRKQENLLKYIHPILSPDRKDIVLEVECGANKGFLYLSRLCRGSRGPCILFQETWLTPNQFQAVSGRETAKDWKRSIRHRGRSVKLLMSKGILPQNSECHYQTGTDTSTTLHVSVLFVTILVKNVYRLLLIFSEVLLKWNLTRTLFLFALWITCGCADSGEFLIIFWIVILVYSSEWPWWSLQCHAFGRSI